MKHSSIKKSGILFYIGIINLFISIFFRIGLTFVNINKGPFGFRYPYTSCSVYVLLTIVIMICGLLVEIKKLPREVFAIPLLLLVVSLIRHTFSFSYFAYDYLIDVILYALMLYALVIGLNKVIMIISVIVASLLIGGVDIGYYAYYLFLRLIVWQQPIRTYEFIQCVLNMLTSLTFYLGFALVMKRMLEYKPKLKVKPQRFKKTMSAEEMLTELKRQYDAGIIDENEYNAKKKDVLDKL